MNFELLQREQFVIVEPFLYDCLDKYFISMFIEFSIFPKIGPFAWEKTGCLKRITRVL